MLSTFRTTELWTMQCSLAQLEQHCARVATALLAAQPFCLWLQGEVGAGKTSWVRVFLQHLGLDCRIAVTSPTFTYAREYEIAGELYNHCDLYRVDSVATYHTLGIATRLYRGILLEWATVTNCTALPTHLLRIEMTPSDSRRYVFYRCSGCVV